MRSTRYRCAVLLSLLAYALAADAQPVRKDRDDLTEDYAKIRRAQVKNVTYDLEFTLSKEASTFDGAAHIIVDLNRADLPLSIDLNAERIQSVRVNGAVATDIVERKGSFDIPAAHLKTGRNAIDIAYTAAYSTTGLGLCHMTDPVDGKEYLYTNLEPYGAHNVFPCLDQPDIKATYSMRVSAPRDWVVIGNQPVASEEKHGDQKTVRFNATPSLSTYLFFLGAGGYQSWHNTHNEVSLTIYARDSLAEYVDAERIFSETKAGLDYFNRFFEMPYPFEKYDHIFAPELRPGAMENPGAVTMNEYMLFRGPVTSDDYRSRNNTLLHEMAHMWFGNLVTMVWWNDLWLNESLATFSAYQAQANMGDANRAWRDFYGLKGWAYYQDQLSTTHPIETAVPSAR
ncbi:MAG: M1 family aminopeptidase, partial [Candidatus Hydrogenedentes bacterium]|nr:M1 family aminopeptidase [Candidatus Hydrogenedentota bacterium]